MKSRIVTILRDKVGRKQSTGIFIVQDENGNILFTSKSLERGWLNNLNNISCVPAGNYKLVLEYSPKFNTNLWELYGVVNRRECKVHVANYWHELNGCIAPGVTQADINHDGYVDNVSSRNALKGFHEAMQGFTTAEIRIINNQF